MDPNESQQQQAAPEYQSHAAEPAQVPKRPKDDRFKLGKREILLIVIALATLIGVGLFAWNLSERKQQEANEINTFEECVAAGNPVMESYPEQCAANGRTFTNLAQQLDPQ